MLRSTSPGGRSFKALVQSVGRKKKRMEPNWKVKIGPTTYMTHVVQVCVDIFAEAVNIVTIPFWPGAESRKHSQCLEVTLFSLPCSTPPKRTTINSISSNKVALCIYAELWHFLLSQNVSNNDQRCILTHQWQQLASREVSMIPSEYV